MTADLDRLDALAAAAEGHWPTLVFEDGDGDLVRCSCGDQGFDFKQGREWFAEHVVGLMHATIRELVAAARERDELRAALISEDEIAHGEAWEPSRGGLGICAYCDDEWPCRTQRGINRALHPEAGTDGGTYRDDAMNYPPEDARRG